MGAFGRLSLLGAALLAASAALVLSHGTVEIGLPRESSGMERAAASVAAALGLRDDADSMLRHYIEGVELAESDLSIRKAIELDHRVGRPAAARGDLETVYETYRKVLAISYRLGSRQGIAIALPMLGWVFESMGRPEDEIAMNLLAYEVQRPTNHRYELGVQEVGLGRVLGRQDRSLGMMWRIKAKTSLEGTPHLQDRVSLLTDLAGDFEAEQQPERALRHHEQAWELAQTLGSKPTHRVAKREAGIAYFRALAARERCADALELAEAILPVFSEEERATHAHYSFLNSVAACHGQLGNAELARAADHSAYAYYEIDRARQLGEEGRARIDRVGKRVVDWVVDAYVAAGDYRSALALLETNKARTLNDALGDPGQREAYASWAALEASQAVERADLLEEPRGGLVRHLLRKSGLPVDAYDYFRLLRKQEKELAQLRIDADLRRLPVKAALGPDDVEAMEQSLDEATALVSLYNREEGLGAFIVTSRGTRYVTIEMRSAEYSRATREFQIALSNPYTDFYLRPAQQLYHRYFAPVEEGLGPTTSVVFYSPDGAFSRLPLSALHDGEAFLVERFDLRRVPSLRFLGALKPGHRRRIVKRGVACVDPAIAEARLPEQQATGSVLQALYPESVELLTGERCSPNELQAALGTLEDSAFLHIGAHGRFYEPDALRSGIWLASDAGSTQGQLWDARAIGSLDLGRIELVTLSSCEAGVTDPRNPRDVFGVPRTLLFAGAGKVVAPLWVVQAEPTALLMRRFYREYAAGTEAGAALRKAQLELIADERLRHPSFWAAFQLVGGSV